MAGALGTPKAQQPNAFIIQHCPTSCLRLYARPFFQNRRNLENAYEYTRTRKYQYFTQISDVQIFPKSRNSTLLIDFEIFIKLKSMSILCSFAKTFEEVSLKFLTNIS